MTQRVRGGKQCEWKAAVVDKGIWCGQTSQSQKYICSNGKFDQGPRNKIALKLFSCHWCSTKIQYTVFHPKEFLFTYTCFKDTSRQYFEIMLLIHIASIECKTHIQTSDDNIAGFVMTIANSFLSLRAMNLPTNDLPENTMDCRVLSFYRLALCRHLCSKLQSTNI